MADMGMTAKVRVDRLKCGRRYMWEVGAWQAPTRAKPHIMGQERVRSGAIELRKVNGLVSTADLLTKHLTSRDRATQLIELLNCECRIDRLIIVASRHEFDSERA